MNSEEVAYSFGGPGYETRLLSEINRLVAAERDACAKAICEGCAEGWPTEDIDGDLLHILPQERWRPWERSAGNRTTCEAAAIRARQ